jgi:hypothetical protein
MSKIPIKDNGSIHDCDICIHKGFCKKTEKSLRDNHAERFFHTVIPVIYIPHNCSIIANQKLKIKVILI